MRLVCSTFWCPIKTLLNINLEGVDISVLMTSLKIALKVKNAGKFSSITFKVIIPKCG